MGMMEHAVGIVLTVALFMIIAYVFINMFGYPTCASMANQTALQLKHAISEVAKDEFPFYNNDGVPTDTKYYAEVPIRLCNEFISPIEVPYLGIQLPGYAYLLQFLGGMPEYQIYYEHFPQEGWLWNEAYPWSGGAATSFVFWGAMRGVTWLAPRVASLLSYKTIAITGVGKIVISRRNLGYLKKLVKSGGVDDAVTEFLGMIAKKSNNIDTFLEALGKYDVTEIVDLLGDADILVKQLDGGEVFYQIVTDGKGGFKFVLNDQDVIATVLETDPTTGIQKVKQVFAYQKADGTFDWTNVKLLDPGEAIPQDYAPLMVNYKKQMEEIYDALKETQPARADMLLDQFVIKGDAINPILLKDQILDVNWVKQIYNGLKERWESFKIYLRTNDYLTDNTVRTGVTGRNIGVALYDTSLELNDAGKTLLSDGDTTVGKYVREKVLKNIMESEDLGVWDNLRYKASKIGIGTGPTVDIELGLRINNRWWEETGGGFLILPKKSATTVHVKFIDNLIDLGDSATPDSMIALAESTLSEFSTSFKVYKDVGGWTDYANELKGIWPGAATEAFKKNAEALWLKRVATELFEIEKNPLRYGAQTEDIKRMFEYTLGSYIGNLKKDFDAAPLNLWADYGYREIRKTLFIDGTALVAPNSWIGKGLILEQMTEGCRGNSICLYVHASQYESPYYMSEDAIKFSGNIRVWRPVDPWKNYLGWQAIMMQVPSHPRFYVVSPCFAIAKVWKTVYNDKETIFVYPIKVDMEDKSSNYCYADENLINSYTAIWAAEDFATIIEAVLSSGTASARLGLTKVAESTLFKWWNAADPASFLAAMAEAAISWPGYPYRDLNYTDMNSEAGNTAFGELEEHLRSEAE